MVFLLPGRYGIFRNFENFTLEEGLLLTSHLGTSAFALFYIKLVWIEKDVLVKLASATTSTIFVQNQKQTKVIYNTFKVILFTIMLFTMYADYLAVLTDAKPSTRLAFLSDTFKKTWYKILYVFASDYQYNFLLTTNNLFLALVIALYGIRVEFEQCLVNKSFKKGLKLLRNLQKKLEYINNVVGTMLLLFYATVVSHYCEFPALINSEYFKDHPIL